MSKQTFLTHESLKKIKDMQMRKICAHAKLGCSSLMITVEKISGFTNIWLGSIVQL